MNAHDQASDLARPPMERRAFERHPCHLPAHIRGGDEQTEMDGIVCNLSPGGIGVTLPAPLPPGPAMIYVRGENSTGGYLKLARVIFHQRGIADEWLHGAVFDTPLSPESVRYLLGR